MQLDIEELAKRAAREAATSCGRPMVLLRSGQDIRLLSEGESMHASGYEGEDPVEVLLIALPGEKVKSGS